MHQFLAARYPAILKESPAAASEEVASVEVLPVDLVGEGDSDFAHETEGLSLSSRVSIYGSYERVHEECFSFEKLVPSLVAGLLSFASRGVEAIRESSIPEVCVSVLKSRFFSFNRRIREFESQSAWEN